MFVPLKEEIAVTRRPWLEYNVLHEVVQTANCEDLLADYVEQIVEDRIAEERGSIYLDCFLVIAKKYNLNLIEEKDDYRGTFTS